MEQDVLLVVRLTTPAKPFTAATDIEEVPALPAFTVTDAGVAVIVKSWTTYVTVTECERLVLVLVTPTWKVPPEAHVHDRVALQATVTLVGETVHDEVASRTTLTTRAKAFAAATV